MKELELLAKNSLGKKEINATDTINNAGFNVMILEENGITYNKHDPQDSFCVSFIVNSNIVTEVRYMNLNYRE